MTGLLLSGLGSFWESLILGVLGVCPVDVNAKTPPTSAFTSQ